MKNYYSVFLLLSGSFSFINGSLLQVHYTRDGTERIDLHGSIDGFDICVVRNQTVKARKNKLFQRPFYQLLITDETTGKKTYLTSDQYNYQTGNLHVEPEYYFNRLAQSSVLFKLYDLHRRRDKGLQDIF